MGWRLGILCLAVVLGLAEPRARAAECANIKGGVATLAQVDAATRLHFIQGELRHSARRARMWTWGWVMALGTLSGAQLALLPAYAQDAHVDLYVGAGTAFVGMASVIILPPSVMADQRRLDAIVRRAPPDADPCALLADAERFLVRDAKDADPRGRWLLHAGNVLLNLGAGLILGLAFDRWQTAFINGLAGIAIGEVLVLTRPTDAVSALLRYRMGELGVPAKVAAIGWGAGVQLDRDRYLLRVGMTF